MKLTQCLIVKDEEKNLPRALNWGKGLFDEVIVVDTGSKDTTPELAKKLGAKVIHYKWKQDFSAARNFAISKCTGDWIFFLDADEYFLESDVSLLRPLIEKIDKQYDMVNGEKHFYNAVEMPWVNMSNGSVSRQTRIFRNDPHLRYTGAIHERLDVTPGGYIKVFRVDKRPAIYHTGYIWSQDNSMLDKTARNLDIALSSLKKEPNNARLMLFAAESLMMQGRYSEAEKYFSKAMENSDGSIWSEREQEGYKQWLSIYMNMAQNIQQAAQLLESAQSVYKRAVAKFTDDADFDILMSMFYFKFKDIRKTMEYFNSSLSKKDGDLTKKLKSSDNKIYETLRRICDKMKENNML